MATYEFESIAVRRRREGKVLAVDYREVVEQRAATGWRLVQVLDFSKYVEPRLELIFVKE